MGTPGKEESGRWKTEAGEEGRSGRWTGQEHGGGSEGWRAQPRGLRRLPRAEWVGEHQGVPYSWNPSGGSSLSLVFRRPIGGGVPEEWRATWRAEGRRFSYRGPWRAQGDAEGRGPSPGALEVSWAQVKGEPHGLSQ